MREKKVSIINLFLSFLKVGTIGFGGGSALIPVVENEIVQNKKAMSEQDYLKHTVVANITPGALPVKLGATCGHQLKGPAGSLAGALGVTIPGLIFTVAFMALFSILGGDAINYFNYASVGITAFIVFLLISYVVKTVKSGDFKINMSLCIAAFALTGGKEVREILSQLLKVEPEVFGTPLFDISTIDLIILSFFVILLLEKIRNKTEFYFVLSLCLLYAFCKGKTGKLLGLNTVGSILLILMIGIAIMAFVVRREKSKNKTKLSFGKSDIVITLLYLLIPILLTVAAMIFIPMKGYNLIDFLVKITSSTVTSFGGGEAYVSVADGIFVQGGYIKPDLFYTRLVPVANSLPGPILVKIAAGMGFLFGQQAGGTVAGWVVALISGVTAMGVCCAIAIVVLTLYDSVKELQFITNLKKYILPVICGMLISTSAAMLFESMKITGGKGISGFISLPAILLSIYGLNFLHRKYGLHDVILLILSAVLSLGVLLVF